MSGEIAKIFHKMEIAFLKRRLDKDENQRIIAEMQRKLDKAKADLSGYRNGNFDLQQENQLLRQANEKMEKTLLDLLQTYDGDVCPRVQCQSFVRTLKGDLDGYKMIADMTGLLKSRIEQQEQEIGHLTEIISTQAEQIQMMSEGE